MSSIEKVIERLEGELAEAKAEIGRLRGQERGLKAFTVERLKEYVVALRTPDATPGKARGHAYYLENPRVLDELFEFYGMLAAGLAKGRLDQEHCLAIAARAIRLYEEGYEKEIPF